jgi:cytoskeletal protein CcmA (bactofilin family)
LSDPKLEATRVETQIATIVEAGTRFEGLVSFRGAVRVEGLIVGQVVAEGALFVGAQGELRGRIEADEVTIEGSCEGEIEARHRIELRPTARVRGRIRAPRILMADGSCFDGRCDAGLPPLVPAEEERVRRPEAGLLPALETASISA